MTKMTGSRYITNRLPGLIAAIAFAVALLASCSGEKPVPQGNDDGAMLNLAFRVASPSSAISRAGEYEDGTALESTIDFATENYRVYFFDGGQNYITEWKHPYPLHVLSTGIYTIYTFTGAVPEELKTYTDFSVMVLANWPDYPELHSISLENKKIVDILEAEWAKFKAFDSFELSVSARRLIPFYGFASFENIEFAENHTYDLGNVNLLRAVAKVEVNVDVSELPEDVTVEDVLIRGINPKGYCAPLGPIGTGSSWNTDYVEKIHLPFDGNRNSATAMINDAQMLRLGGSDTWNTWIAYLPEFDNKNAGENYSRIELKLSYRDEPFVIHFAEYDADGRTDNADVHRYDIRRNDLYRFNVKGDLHEILFNLEVEPWEFGGKTEIEM